MQIKAIDGMDLRFVDGFFFFFSSWLSALALNVSMKRFIPNPFILLVC